MFTKWTASDFDVSETTALEFAKRQATVADAHLFLAQRMVHRAAGACVDITEYCALLMYDRWRQQRLIRA